MHVFVLPFSCILVQVCVFDRFELDPMASRWDSRYAQLRELAARHGGHLPRLPADDGLYAWLVHQQRQWRDGKLSPERCASWLWHAGMLGCVLI